ncbi:uncharacterized protein BJ171DRAFT_485698 [Polychytrium aggregatum]|uniref:uncharacterized protein n=1 Tax=Polychytrium aggregatum TaxID=110093 RepID=UPI0022FE9741|nr:uncharacterized protein BJ171DRAFT_485698 [Polychytrium aggregatum]KAI9209189.1 hypothetical protein BJ171DRAFT_485698 [Polychytrium aggregatum]
MNAGYPESFGTWSLSPRSGSGSIFFGHGSPLVPPQPGCPDPGCICRSAEANPQPRTSESLAAEAINEAIDNAKSNVDLSELGLVDIPKETESLGRLVYISSSQYFDNKIQLYLSKNSLRRLSPSLFMLQNLSVLSLRDNRLQFIPPEIGLLQNLRELCVGNNELQFLPVELYYIKNLTLRQDPNPFRICPEIPPASLSDAIIRPWPSATAGPAAQAPHVPTGPPPLSELARRQLIQLFNTMSPKQKSDLLDFPPYRLHLEFQHGHLSKDYIRYVMETLPHIYRCSRAACGRTFFTASVEMIRWSRFGSPTESNRRLPFVHRYCCVHCAQSCLKIGPVATDFEAAIEAASGPAARR